MLLEMRKILLDFLHKLGHCDMCHSELFRRPFEVLRSQRPLPTLQSVEFDTVSQLLWIANQDYVAVTVNYVWTTAVTTGVSCNI